MQQKTRHTLKTVVQENSHTAYGLSAQMVQLEVIEGVVARLLVLFMKVGIKTEEWLIWR